MGGVKTEPFDISTSTTAIEKYIRIQNTTGALRIYCTNGSTTGWYIDDISVTQPAGTFEMTNVSLRLHNNLHSSGTSSDHYIALSDSDDTGTIQIFSKADNSWGTPITGLTSNSSGNKRKDVFFFADGVLRVCDAEFANNNLKVWYGYIDRVWFPRTAAYPINEWVLSSNILPAPISLWHISDAPTIDSDYESGQNSQIVSSLSNSHNNPTYNNCVGYMPKLSACDDSTSTGNSHMIDDVGMYDFFNGDGESGGLNIVRVTTVIKSKTVAFYNGQEIYWTFTCGKWSDPENSGTGYDSTVKTQYRMSTYQPGANTLEEVVEFLFHPHEIPLAENWGSGNYDGLKVEAKAYLFDFDNESFPPEADNYGLYNAMGPEQGLLWDRLEHSYEYGNSTVYKINVFEGSTDQVDNIDDLLSNGVFTSNALVTLWEWDATTGGAGWQNANVDQEWELAGSFIYDENQESLLTYSLDDASFDDLNQYYQMRSTNRIKVPADTNVASRPQLFIAIKSPQEEEWNKRITGFRLYLRNVSDHISPLYLLCTGDFLEGRVFVEPSQTYVKASTMINLSGEPYYGFNIPEILLSTPPNHMTYEMVTGRDIEEQSLDVDYKCVTMAGKRLYVGNLKVKSVDGSRDYRADGMLKSESFAYDVFPSKNIIDVSTNDGDEIIALENYADRILQFKRRKMHIINISQDSEFLEATHDFKGVESPGAVCKTDSGVAWVNEEGVYLYDGQKVIDLLMKKNIRRINLSYFSAFLGTKPIIGYVPNRKQIIIKTGTSGNVAEDNIMIFDMTTYSWTKGIDKFPVSNPTVAQTNFANDELGNLILGYSDGDIQKWDTSAAASSKFEIVTKDYIFGDAGVRKKIYKVYISYIATGATDASTNITCKFRVNGETTTERTFANGTGITSNDLLCTDAKWSRAELKPSTASQANNIYSFQLHLKADGAVPSDFKINDINIIYRAKTIK